MAQDEFKPRGPTKASKPDAGGGNTREVPVFGIVKDNVDPTRSGRLKVYIGDKGGSDADNSESWVTVNYMSNFFGKIIPDAGSDGYGSYKSNPSSYGEWHAPPDIGTTVICIFINGDPNYGFYIGCVPEADALQMVPAIGSSDNIIANGGEADSYGGAVRLPVTNINTNNKSITDSPEYVTAARPVHSYTASIMNQQGIIRDPIRGPISSSAQREAASRVGWGVSTPGRPIYDGGYTDESVVSNLDPDKAQSLRVVARRGGHSIVMDDGDIIGRDQLIRIRTALGHQILMSDDGQTLMILHSNGQSYIELGKEGTIDMYATNSVNIRTQGDLNLHSDRNVNIHAMEDFKVQAKNIKTNSEETTAIRATKDIKTHAVGNFLTKAGGVVSLGAGGDASLAAGGLAYVNGSKVNLNTGSISTQPEEVPVIPIIAQTDTLYDEQKGFMAAPGKLLTIASRAPAHAPWANAGQGVDVKTDLNASSQLPSSPSSAVATTNEAGAATSPTPVSVATAASTPSVPSVSSAMDSGTTNAVLGAVATGAASGPLASAVQAGAGVVSTAAGKVAAVGSFAQSPTQLMNSSVLKPGSATLINGLVQSGANITKAMPSALFTGQSGAQNLTQLVTSTASQATSVVKNLQQAQTALGSVGVLTGKEAPAQVAGLVTAAATVGLGPTVGAVKSIAGSLTSGAAGLAGGVTGALNAAGGAALGAATGAITGAAGDALKAIGSGAAAAGVATTVTGGLGGIAGALNAMGSSPGLSGLLDSAKGVAGSAFSAIKNSFKSFTPGVPQNLTAIAKTAAAQTAEVASQGSQIEASLVGAGSSALGSLTSVAGAAATVGVGAVTGALNNAISGVTGGATTLNNAINIAASSLNTKNISTTLGGVTGITSSVTNPVNLISSAVGKTVSTLATNAIHTVSALGGAGATMGNGGLSGLPAAASVIQRGAAAATSSALASGLNNIPGGIKTVGAVLNNAPGALNAIPGADKLTGLISEASSAAMNGLKLPEIPGGLNALTSIAKTGLGAGAAAELSSAISALSSGTGGAIKLPTLGFNTVDRSSITAQIGTVLGDPGIPPPNLVGEISDQAKDTAQKLADDSKQILDTIDQLDEWNDKIDKAKLAYYAADASLPQGDPGIKSARDAWFALLDDPTYKSLTGKLDTLAGTADIPATVDAGSTDASIQANANQTSIAGLISDGASSASGLLGTISGAATGSLSGLTSSVGSATKSLLGAASGAINGVSGSSLVSSVSKLNTSSVQSIVGDIAGQGASSIKTLQASVAANVADINNSIAGITGPITNATGSGTG